MEEKVFLKYVYWSILTYVVEILLFSLIMYVYSLFDFKYAYFVIISTFISRSLAANINFFGNKNVVFKSTSKRQRRKSFVLGIIRPVLSAIFVYFVYKLSYDKETLIKFAVDMLLFVMIYLIQRYWIFKKT